MSKAPAFQLYAGDFLVDSADWTLSEMGLYCRMLYLEWANGPLPTDKKRLARATGCDARMLQKCWSHVSSKFVTSDDGLSYTNLRLESEREKQRQYSENQSEKGKKRAEKMWEGHIATAIPTAKPVLQPKDSSSSSSSSSIDKKKEKILSLGSFGNVKLSEMESQKLKDKFGEDGTTDRIEKLSQYIASKGKKYKSHYATILMWASKDGGGNGNGTGS
jgi:uncharacterized protein YdaU (DUF1376 family)